MNIALFYEAVLGNEVRNSRTRQYKKIWPPQNRLIVQFDHSFLIRRDRNCPQSNYGSLICKPVMSEPTAKSYVKEDMYVCPLNRDIYIYIYI